MFEIHAAYDEIPVFVKDGAMIPVANPVLHIDKDTVFEMTVKIFGEADGRFVLYEDDFDTFAYEEKQKQIVIEKHPGSELTIQAESGKMSRYRFVK